jgi:hypothetical protein
MVDITDIGMDVVGSTIKAYIKTADCRARSWSAVSSRSDATYSAAGRPALAFGPNVVVDGFIAGPYAAGGGVTLNQLKRGSNRGSLRGMGRGWHSDH